MTLTTLILLSAATWRLASLVANEAGPFGIFEKFRAWCKSLCETNRFCAEFRLYESVECEWCNSIWIGMLVTAISAAFIKMTVPEILGLPLALSTGAILLKYLIQSLENKKSSLEMQPAASDKGSAQERLPKRRYISS